MRTQVRQRSLRQPWVRGAKGEGKEAKGEDGGTVFGLRISRPSPTVTRLGSQRYVCVKSVGSRAAPSREKATHLLPTAECGPKSEGRCAPSLISTRSRLGRIFASRSNPPIAGSCQCRAAVHQRAREVGMSNLSPPSSSPRRAPSLLNSA